MAKRKGYARRRKDGMWGFRIRLTDPATGRKTRRLQVYDFSTKADAEAAAMVLLSRDRNARFGVAPPAPSPSLQTLVEKRLPLIQPAPERTRATRVLNTWIKLLPPGIRVEQIFTPQIQTYVDRRAADGQSPASINRELNIIAATLHAASQLLPELAQWRPPKIPRPRVSKIPRRRVITDDEYRRLIDRLTRPPDEQDADRRQNRRNAHRARLRVANIFRFAMNTGMRPKEIYGLRWADVDFDGGQIRVRGTKTDSERYVPISQPAREILAAEKGSDRPVFVFTEGGNPTPKIYRVLREACEAVGIPYGRKVLDGFDLYCSRHTFTTRLLQAGHDVRTVGAITGHSDREMVLHYSHVTPAATARAIASIEAIEAARAEKNEGNGHELAKKEKDST